MSCDTTPESWLQGQSVAHDWSYNLANLLSAFLIRPNVIKSFRQWHRHVTLRCQKCSGRQPRCPLESYGQALKYKGHFPGVLCECGYVPAQIPWSIDPTCLPSQLQSGKNVWYRQLPHLAVLFAKALWAAALGSLEVWLKCDSANISDGVLKTSLCQHFLTFFESCMIR